MPELPEVETIRRGLIKKVINKKIKNVRVLMPKIIKSGADGLIAFLRGKQIKQIDRIGKLLIFSVDSRFLLVHLKLTGQLIYRKNGNIVAGGHIISGEHDLTLGKHSVFVITFDDDSVLFMNDMRQFAMIKLVDVREKDAAVSQFGIEPLQPNFTFEAFKKRLLAHKRSAIKKVLMDQKQIAGIGNIYADEICFAAKVLPSRLISSLEEAEVKLLYESSNAIIKFAIEKCGTTFRDYRDSEGRVGKFQECLKVFGRKGEKCPRCRDGVIKKIKLGGRGTHFCPKCQM